MCGPSTQRALQSLAGLFAHALALVILVVFSRNMFSTASRMVLGLVIR
jgi:hypothetical protein